MHMHKIMNSKGRRLPVKAILAVLTYIAFGFCFVPSFACLQPNPLQEYSVLAGIICLVTLSLFIVACWKDD